MSAWNGCVIPGDGRLHSVRLPDRVIDMPLSESLDHGVLRRHGGVRGSSRSAKSSSCMGFLYPCSTSCVTLPSLLRRETQGRLSWSPMVSAHADGAGIRAPDITLQLRGHRCPMSRSYPSLRVGELPSSPGVPTVISSWPRSAIPGSGGRSWSRRCLYRDAKAGVETRERRFAALTSRLCSYRSGRSDADHLGERW